MWSFYVLQRSSNFGQLPMLDWRGRLMRWLTSVMEERMETAYDCKFHLVSISVGFKKLRTWRLSGWRVNSLDYFLNTQGRKIHAIIWFPIDLDSISWIQTKESSSTYLMTIGCPHIIPNWWRSNDSPLSLPPTTFTEETTAISQDQVHVIKQYIDLH